jgi:hypothetical protein
MIRYRMTTSTSAMRNADETDAQAWMPALSVRNGQLAMERGLHQEIGWERRTENSDTSVLVFGDKIDDPVMEAMVRRGSPAMDSAAAGSLVLYDPSSGMVRAAGPGFSTIGMMATAQHKLGKGSQVRVSYANGTALTLASASQASALAQVLASARARHAQSCSISLSGTLEGTGTRWRATYRWQPETTITPVAMFAQNADDPYLNLQIRQPIRFHRDGASGFEALVNLGNLLAQGYRPFVLSDGSVLVFAQDQRSVSGGVAFNF